MEAGKILLYEVEAYVTNFITEQVPKEYAYHDVHHTLNVVAAVKELAKRSKLPDSEQEVLQLAAWFHDTGYDKGSMEHEERSCRYAREYLSKYEYPEDKIRMVEECIRATKMPQQPSSVLQKIMCDADLSHLGRDVYWDRCNRVRQELAVVRNITMDNEEWLRFELKFLAAHQYHTEIARALFEKQKKKHIRQLQKRQQASLNEELETVEELLKREKKKEKKQKRKEKKPQNTATTQLPVAQSKTTSLAMSLLFSLGQSQNRKVEQIDQQANVMLGINALVVVACFAVLMPLFLQSPQLIVPTFILLATCLLSIVLASLITRMSIKEGNLLNSINYALFQHTGSVNPHLLQLPFHHSANSNLSETDMLSQVALQDISEQSSLLSRKKQYLHLCHQVFLYGLILSSLAFAIAFLNI